MVETAATSLRPRRSLHALPTPAILFVLTGLLLIGASPAYQHDDGTFGDAMEAAMHRMHRDMQVPSSGSVDRDFAAMMIPHHRAAVEMAELQLRYGADQRLRRLAQGIIVEQKQEIAVMEEVLAALPSGPLQGRESNAGGGTDLK
ncbi:MAG TPA: DUF305 domain-containing protein [Allosphingosinicella sp.]